jgi:hypothetical protein
MRAGIFLVCLITCGTASAGELPGPDLRDALVGQTIKWWEDGGWHAGELSLLLDGRAEIRIDAPAAMREEGSWQIRGNELCTSWSTLRQQQTKCYSVKRTGPNRFVTSGGNVFVVLAAGA